MFGRFLSRVVTYLVCSLLQMCCSRPRCSAGNLFCRSCFWARVIITCSPLDTCEQGANRCGCSISLTVYSTCFSYRNSRALYDMCGFQCRPRQHPPHQSAGAMSPHRFTLPAPILVKTGRAPFRHSRDAKVYDYGHAQTDSPPPC